MKYYVMLLLLVEFIGIYYSKDQDSIGQSIIALIVYLPLYGRILDFW